MILGTSDSLPTSIRRGAIGLLLAAAVGCADADELARRHLAQGEQYMAEQDYANAVVEFRNAVKNSPRLGPARLKLGEAFLRTGNLQSAVRELVRAADLMPDDRNTQLQAGNALLVAGDYEYARTIAERLLKQNHRDVSAQILLGYAFAGLKDLDAAVRELREVLTQDPSQLGYRNIGELYVAQGNYSLAETSFHQAIKLDPASIDGHLALANLYWATGRPEAARKTLQQALAAKPDSATANRAMALYLLSAGQMVEAEAYLKHAAAVSTATEDALLLSDYYSASGRFSDARAVLEPVAAQPKAPLDAVLRLAELHYVENRKPQAHSAVDALLKKSAKNAPALALKSRFLLSDGRPQEALDTATKATTANPELFAAHYARAMASAALRQNADTISALNEAIRLRPRAFEVHLHLARGYLAQGNNGSAEQFARSALVLRSNSREARVTLAQALVARRDFAGAEAEVRYLLEHHANWAQSHIQHGYTLLVRNDRAAAIAAFQRALALDPTAIQALRMVTLMEIGLNKSNDAWARLNKRLAEKPDDPELLLLQADAHVAGKDETGAERALLRVLQVAPNNLDAYGRLGQLYMSQRRLEPARQQFEELAARHPKSIGPVTMIAYIYELQKNTEGAKKAYEKVLQIDSRAAVAANNLAWLYTEEGTNLDMAVQLAQTAHQVLPDEPAVSDTLGVAYYKKGLPQLAIPILLQSVEKQPKNATFQYHLGLAYAKAGETARARTALQAALALDANFEGAAEARSLLATMQS